MKSILKKLIVSTLRLFINLFGRDWGIRIRNVLRQAMDVEGIDATIEIIDTARGPIRFYCLGDLARWRAETLLTKEPETIQWIDRFGDTDVLYDVGANMGVYSLYAACKKNLMVLAFEPSAANYYLLSRNIQENALEDRVQAYCLALNDKNTLDQLHLRDVGFAHSMASFATAVGSDGKTFEAAFKQRAVGLSLDSFIELFSAPCPNHLKIDVDGIEERIIDGAVRTLSNPQLKSVLVELDTSLSEETQRIIKKFDDAGMTLLEKRRSPMFDGTEHANIYNHIFVRRTEGS